MATQAERIAALETGINRILDMLTGPTASAPVQPVTPKVVGNWSYGPGTSTALPSMGQLTGEIGPQGDKRIVTLMIPSNVNPGQFLVTLVKAYGKANGGAPMPANKQAVGGFGVFRCWNEFFAKYLHADNPAIDASTALALVRKSLVAQKMLTYSRVEVADGEKINCYGIPSAADKQSAKAVATQDTLPDWVKAAMGQLGLGAEAVK